ncbi:MAG: IS21 family transposase, partial [Candidatus Hatepunaea meridiana]|nr:IS21 family transposase [Candidatus Hatepunaea meridiana]
SLSHGLQNALWSLGGIPGYHRTDRLSSAVKKADSSQEFTDRYSGLLRHYHLKWQKTQVRKPNENGDIEQRNCR